MEIRLTGWKAFIAAVALLGFVGFRYLMLTQTLDTDGRQAIEAWVASEYQRHHLARNDLSDEDKAAILLQIKSITLTSISARGKPDNLAVRVRLGPHPAHPPQMPYERYFRMQYSTLTGWRHQGNISALQYHLTSLW